MDTLLMAKQAKDVVVGDFVAVASGGVPGLKVAQVIFDESVVLVLESEGGTHTFEPDELVVLLKRA